MIDELLFFEASKSVDDMMSAYFGFVTFSAGIIVLLMFAIWGVSQIVRLFRGITHS